MCAVLTLTLTVTQRPSLPCSRGMGAAVSSDSTMYYLANALSSPMLVHLSHHLDNEALDT